MSGGSWNYAHSRVFQTAEEIEEEDNENYRKHPLRGRLVNHLKELSVLMRLIEWCDSGDKGPDEWIEPAKKFFDRITEVEE